MALATSWNLFLVISSIAVQLGHKLCGFIHAHEFTQHGLVIGDAVSHHRQVRGLDLFFQVFQDLLCIGMSNTMPPRITI